MAILFSTPEWYIHLPGYLKTIIVIFVALHVLAVAGIMVAHGSSESGKGRNQDFSKKLR